MASEFLFLAEASTAVGEVAGSTWDWKVIFWGLVGAALLRGVQWLADFMTQGGQKKLLDLLTEALKKSNDTSVGSQIKADDALVKIIEDTIPVVVDTLSANLKQDLADGKLDADQWQRIHALTWAKVKPIVAGGANDYLEKSSWDDGQVVAKYVWDKWIAKRKVEGKE